MVAMPTYFLTSMVWFPVLNKFITNLDNFSLEKIIFADICVIIIMKLREGG